MAVCCGKARHFPVTGLSLVGALLKTTSEHVNPANPSLRAREPAASFQPGGEDDQAARSLIARAEEIFHALHPSAPRGFVSRLYARAVSEDLVAYGADDLARIAAEALLFLSERQPGEPKIRFDV